MAIENLQLDGTTQDLLEAPAGKTYAITSIMVCNTYSPSGAAPASNNAQFDMHFRKDNQPLDVATTIVIRELDLPAGETFTFDSEKVILSPGEKLTFVGDANSNLAAMVSYLEV